MTVLSKPKNDKAKATKLRPAWVVANVYLEHDNYNNLVTCGVVCKSLKEAKDVAFEKAQGLLEVMNEDMRFKGMPEVRFDEAWRRVDHFDGIEQEYGYDPVDNRVSYAAIRVFKCEVMK